MPRPRLFRAALAAAIVATALSPLGSTAQAPGCSDEARRLRPDGWTVLRRPAFSVGKQAVTDWAASAFFDGYLIATNGGAIVRSLDAGCSWEEVFSTGVAFGENRVSLTDESVLSVAMPPAIGRLGYPAYAVVSTIDRSMLVSSTDQGETWAQQPSAGLPLLSRVHTVRVSADPRIVYVVADAQPTIPGLTNGVETNLYVTRDGGTTFAPVQRGLEVRQYTQLVVDPADPRMLWAWDQDALYRSSDSGQTFERMRGVSGSLSTVHVAHYPASEPARIVAYRSSHALASVSNDGGETWERILTPGRVTGAAGVFRADALATTSEIGVFVDVPSLGLQGVNVSPRKLVLNDLAWSGGGPLLTLYGASDKDLYLRRFTRQYRDPVKPKLPPIDLRGGGLLKVGPTIFAPDDEVVRLKPGERRTVQYTLDLAPTPTPLDIFFATDSTGSMSDVIAGLRTDLQDIIDDLAEAGIDVWFGVGDFKDYSTFAGANDHPYKRFRKVGPIDEELEEAIAAIETGGGNTYDSALAATYQAATGEGQRRFDDATGEKAGWWVEPGQGAEWREDAMKVLVIAADVRSRDPQTDKGYPGPSYRKVIDALNLLEIEHVGLAVGSSPAEPLQSLGRVSRGTRTLAPAGGIDCDDDGEVDIDEGMPLVCELPSDGNGTNLAPAMVGLLKSLEDLKPVSLRLTGDSRTARVTGTGLFDAVNVKDRNKLRFSVETHCDEELAGETFRHTVEARVAGKAVESTKLTVVCLGKPKRPAFVPPVPPPAVRVLIAAAAPPPPPPPAPVQQPQVNSNPNPNPNPNPQPVTQAQAGIAYQDQVQVDVALADIQVGTEDELAMVGVRDTDAAAAGVLVGGMVIAAGAAVALRQRTKPAPARVRSSG